MINNKQFILALAAFMLLNGCSVILQKGRRSDAERIQALEEKKRFQMEHIQSLEEKIADLANTKKLLEDKLAKELAEKKVRVEMEDKGLVITFVAEVLFDSGKARIRKQAYSSLDKIAKILKEEVPNNNISIEGHTDNVPIKFSKWKSNWELSAHRALSVLYYLESKNVDPNTLSATGYGEYKSIASNDNAEGRQLNRRVEIVIMPDSLKTVQQRKLEGSSSPGEEENLK